MLQFYYDTNTKVVNVEFGRRPDRKLAKRIELLSDGRAECVDLTENDMVFITNGGCVENSTLGSQNAPAAFLPEIKPGGIVTVKNSNWLISQTFNRTEMDLGFKEKLVLHETLKKIVGTDIEKLLKEYHLI